MIVIFNFLTNKPVIFDINLVLDSVIRLKFNLNKASL